MSDASEIAALRRHLANLETRVDLLERKAERPDPKPGPYSAMPPAEGKKP